MSLSLALPLSSYEILAQNTAGQQNGCSPRQLSALGTRLTTGLGAPMSPLLGLQYALVVPCLSFCLVTTPAPSPSFCLSPRPKESKSLSRTTGILHPLSQDGVLSSVTEGTLWKKESGHLMIVVKHGSTVHEIELPSTITAPAGCLGLSLSVLTFKQLLVGGAVQHMLGFLKTTPLLCGSIRKALNYPPRTCTLLA